MKQFIVVALFFFLLPLGTIAQTQDNRIIANLIRLSSTSFAVDFTVGPSANLTGTANPITVLLRIPIAQEPTDTTIKLDSTNFGLALAQASNDNNGYFLYYFEGPAVDLNASIWDNGLTVRVGVFRLTKPVNTIHLVGGQYGSATSNGSGGFLWPGTALLINNTETNLVSWPITASLSLPIRMSQFNLSKTPQYAKIDWSTYSELNTSHFEIERSRDNKNWEMVAHVPASGHSSTVNSYTYNDPLIKDRSPLTKVFYYRIKSVDLDQSYTYSDIKSIQFEFGALMTLRNTIVKDKLILSYNDINDQDIEFKILDVQGKLMAVHKFQLASGVGIVQIDKDIQELPNGVYHLIGLSSNTQLPSIRFVKVAN